VPHSRGQCVDRVGLVEDEARGIPVLMVLLNQERLRAGEERLWPWRAIL